MTKKFVGWVRDYDNRIYKVVHLSNNILRLHELKSIYKVPYLDGSKRFRYVTEWKENGILTPESALEGGECDLSNCGAGSIWSILKGNNSFHHYEVREKHLSRNLITGKLWAI
jgi:hypothetical protein